MTIISTAVGKNLLEKKWSIPHNQQKKSKIQYLHAISKKKEWTQFLSKANPFNITVIQVYAPTTNAEEVEAEQFYEDLQDLLELTPKKDVLFIIRDWNANVGSQEIPGVTGKSGLGVQMKQGKGSESFAKRTRWS